MNPKISLTIEPDGKYYIIEFGTAIMKLRKVDILRFAGKYYTALADEVESSAASAEGE